MKINRRSWLAQTGLLSLAAALGIDVSAKEPVSSEPVPLSSTKKQEMAPLWSIYEHSLKSAKYVDLTHTITPRIPVWHGFGPSRFLPTVDPATKRPIRTKRTGSRRRTTTSLPTSSGPSSTRPRTGTRTFPPLTNCRRRSRCVRSWSFQFRTKVARDFGYQMQVEDIQCLGSAATAASRKDAVVFVRSDWSKRWPDPALAALTRFPGVSLKAVQFLHLEREDSLPRPRGARYRRHADARKRGVAPQERLHAGRGRGASRRGPRAGRARHDRLSQVSGRHGRLPSLIRRVSTSRSVATAS